MNFEIVTSTSPSPSFLRVAMGQTWSKSETFEKAGADFPHHNGDHPESLGFRNQLFELSSFSLFGRRPSNGHTPSPGDKIIEAVKVNDVEAFQLQLDSLSPHTGDLAAAQEDIAQYTSEEGWNVFHFAAHHQSSEIMERLVTLLKEKDATIVNKRTTNSQEFTALHMVTQSGHLGLVNTLLRHPLIDVNVPDRDNCTPLHHACYHGYTDVVMALQNANFCCTNQEGDSPLHLAVSNHHVGVFSALKECEPFSERYSRNSQFTGLQDQDGNTLLHLAVDSDEVELVEWCLHLGFSPRMPNNIGMNSLHIAARRGSYDITSKLLKAERVGEENVVQFVNSGNQFRSTPLYTAAKFGNVEVMELLLDSNAKIEARNCMGFTPLLAAIRYINPECVRVLLSRGADMMAKDKRKQLNALLWAVEIQSAEILKMLVTHASKIPDLWRTIWKKKDLQGNTAHHIAAKAKSLDMLKMLVQYNTSCLEEKNKDGFTPFHIAVKEGKLAIMSYIVSSSASAIHTEDGQGSLGLHLAAEGGHTSIVERLIKVHVVEVTLCTRNNRGWTPIHLAAKNGHVSTLEFLLENSPKMDSCEILDNDHYTALYLACVNGHPKCVELLIEWGALVTYTYSFHGDTRTMSCLNAAIDSDHTLVVSTILRSKKWHQSLQYCSNPMSKDAETPLRKLIKKMPVAAKTVFDNCVETEKVEDKRGSYYFKINYNYDYVEDFQNLYHDQGPKIAAADRRDGDESQISASPVLQRPDNRALRRQDTRTFNTKHDDAPTPTSSSGTLKHGGTRKDHPVPSHFQHHQPTASPCCPSGLWGPHTFNYKNHPMHLMVLHKRQELLKHRLVASFIHYKWNLFGRWIYYPNIALYAFLMLLLTAYIYLRFDYSKLLIETYERQTNRSISLSDCSQNITLDSLNSSLADVVDTLRGDRNRLIVCSIIIILNCIARILIEIGQIIHHRGEYFLQYINYLEGFLYVATIIFVSNFQLQCLPSWQWQLGAMCIFLSWINFIIFLSQQPIVGIYVVMFQDIIKTFLRMAPMATLLILAFGQPFFMLLSVVEVQTPPQQFVTFPYSLLKTISMTIGEFETDPIFFGTPSVIVYPVVTYILWVIFLIIMPILLQNLLVGLAVDDIKSVQEKAALKKEALQIEFILDVLSRLPKPIVRLRNKRTFTQTWGKGPVEKFWKWLSGSYWKPELKDDKRNEYNMAVKVETMSEMVTAMERKMHSLTEHSVKLERMMLHFSHEQERYFEPMRQEQLRRNKSMFHSEPNLNEVGHKGESREGGVREGGVREREGEGSVREGGEEGRVEDDTV